MSTVRRLVLEPQPKGHCRYCGVKMPDGSRASWHKDCVKAYKLRAWPGELRKAVKRRDRGVCRACGLDTQKVDRLVAALTQLDHDERDAQERALLPGAWSALYRERFPEELLDCPVWSDEYQTADPVTKRRLRTVIGRVQDSYVGQQNAALYRELVGLTGKASTWEADHILSVCEGGGASKDTDPLANMQTLCWQCHKIKTAELATRRRKPKT